MMKQKIKYIKILFITYNIVLVKKIKYSYI